MFRGATTISLDAKGRLAIPTKHRDALQAQCAGNVVVTVHPHGCLLVYPQSVWEPIQARFGELSGFGRLTSMYRDLVVGNAEDISLDVAGRLLISPSLREIGHLNKEVKLVGQVNHFRVWNLDVWNRRMEDVMSGVVDESELKLPPELEGFSL